MRILLVSDLHYSLPQFDWVVDAASEADVLVLAGDHLDISSHVPLPAQVAVVQRYVELLCERTTVVISSGNHDLTGPDEHDEQAAGWIDGLRSTGARVDGESLLVDDVLLTICPWWDGPLGRERVAQQLAADAARRASTWLWVYHWPPTGSTTSWTGTRHYGDADLAGWIGEHRPDLVLAGHVHGPPFRRDGSWIDRVGTSWVLNPGNQRGPMPTCIDVDLADRTATWWSQLGREDADLDADGPPPRTTL